MRPTFLLVLAYLLVTRVFELWLSRRNTRLVLGRGGRLVAHDGLAPLVAVHVAWMVGLLAEELAGGAPVLTPLLRGAAGVLFALAELTRFAAMRSLGERWSMRVIEIDEPSVTSGPYRWLRHPNYVAVVVSVAALPLALGRPWAALVGAPLTLLALQRRLRVENAALNAAG